MKDVSLTQMVAKLAVVVALALGTLSLSGGPVNAHVDSGGSTYGAHSDGKTFDPGEPALPCIKRKVGASGRYEKVTLKSTCYFAWRVKVIWGLGPDTSCFTLKPGQSVTKRGKYQVTYYKKTVQC